MSHPASVNGGRPALPQDPMVVWFLAVLDDEDRALRDIEGDGVWESIATGVLSLGGIDDMDGLATMPRGAAYHCARFDPHRMRAELAARRELVEAYAEVATNPQRYQDPTLNYHLHLLRLVVQTLARPYAHLPGFDPKWRS